MVNVPVASGVVAPTETDVRFVLPSVELIPVSLPATTAGAADAVGAVRSIVSALPAKAAAGPVLVAGSETPLMTNVGVTVPSEHPLAVTLKTVPQKLSGVKVQPVAEPEYVKSLVVRPVIDSLKVRTNTGDAAFV